VSVELVGLLERDIRRLDSLSMKKEAKLSARKIPGVEKGNCEEDLRRKSFVYGLPEALGIVRG